MFLTESDLQAIWLTVRLAMAKGLIGAVVALLLVRTATHCHVIPAARPV